MVEFLPLIAHVLTHWPFITENIVGFCTLTFGPVSSSQSCVVQQR